MANITFGGTDLSNIGELATSRVAGPHSITPLREKSYYLPGSNLRHEQELGPSTRTLAFRCVMRSTDHGGLVAAIENLKVAVSPSQVGEARLEVTDRPNQQILAKCSKLEISFDEIPYHMTGIQFPLEFTTIGTYWEDTTALSADVTSSPATVINSGDILCYPVYTCSVTDTLANGLYFDVGSVRFDYSGALASGDTLVIDSEAMTCKLNGTSTISDTADDCEYPALPTGENTITLSDDTKFSLNISYRRLWE